MMAQPISVSSPAPRTALVSGFARSFASGRPLVGAKITALEDKDFQTETDEEGRFGPFPWPVGSPITLRLEKPGNWWTGYKTTQTATLTVPPEGFNDENHLNNISFQVPSNLIFSLFSMAMGIAEDTEACQVAVTVTPSGTTLDHIPQGTPGVCVSLEPDPLIQPYYFGILRLLNKTNPFESTDLTSEDGGVVIPNVPEGEYVLKAVKDNQVSTLKITACKGILVNVSPPQCLIIEPDSPVSERDEDPEEENFDSFSYTETRKNLS